MRIQKLWGRVREPRTVKKLGIIAGVVVIFGLGVLTGQGRLRIVPRGPFSDQTGLPRTLDYSSVNQLYDTLKANYNGKLTEQQILDGLKHGLANAPGDQYTDHDEPAFRPRSAIPPRWATGCRFHT